MITIEDIKKLIAKDETRTLELKKTTGELYKGMETACAFLNSDGGWLMFGIAPSLKIIVWHCSVFEDYWAKCYR